MDSWWLFYVATVCSVLSAFANNIVNFILSLSHRQSLQCRTLEQEMLDIKKEMEQISMVDEFPRHARLQRKLIKLQQEWKAEANVTSRSKAQAKLVASISIRILLGLVLLSLFYLYGSVPVLEMPTKWFGPFSSLLSWPTGKEGAVSLMLWLLVSGSVCRRYASLIS